MKSATSASAVTPAQRRSAGVAGAVAMFSIARVSNRVTAPPRCSKTLF
jgi:hypothetical protein